MNRIARFFFSNARPAAEAEAFALAEDTRTEPAFGDTVIVTSRMDGFQWAAEFIEANAATGRTRVYEYCPFWKGGSWNERWVDSDMVSLSGKGNAVHVWRLFPELYQ